MKTHIKFNQDDKNDDSHSNLNLNPNPDLKTSKYFNNQNKKRSLQSSDNYNDIIQSQLNESRKRLKKHADKKLKLKNIQTIKNRKETSKISKHRKVEYLDSENSNSSSDESDNFELHNESNDSFTSHDDSNKKVDNNLHSKLNLSKEINESLNSQKKLKIKNHTQNLNQIPPQTSSSNLSIIAKKLLNDRKQLPIYKVKSPLIKLVKSNPVTILVGETGSGKSTQMPQFIANLSKHENIAVTQPRRVAAISLAKRVAQETGSKLGDYVGYAVRFQNCTSHNTKIKFLTDGMLLREFMISNTLSSYSTIILDESHERTLTTDLLMGFLKSLLTGKRKGNLRLIIMSATLNAEHFASFFNTSNIIYVSGRTYPVKTYYLTSSVSDVVDAAVHSALQVNESESQGDILVFLPGQEEIDRAITMISDFAPSIPAQAPKITSIPLYAALPPAAQQKVFDSLPNGYRKIIFATNIAETSLTIPGIRYVIDSGIRKVRVFQADLGLDTLFSASVAQSNAQQRKGRAGREAPGKCFRLYTESSYKKLKFESEPEILRCDVSSAVLTLKAANVQDVLNWNWVQSPGREAILAALLHLYALGALDSSGNITTLGKRMSLLPIPPALAAVVLKSVNITKDSSLQSTPEVSILTYDVVDIVACLSVENVLLNPPTDKRDEIAETQAEEFPSALRYGDLILLREAVAKFRSFDTKKERKEWCSKVCIGFRALNNVLNVSEQILHYLNINSTRKKGSALEKNIDDDLSDDELEIKNSKNQITDTYERADPEEIIKCFLSGFATNTALLSDNNIYKTIGKNQKISIHPSSIVFGVKPPFEAIMFTSYVFTTKAYARMVSPVKISWIQNASFNLENKSSEE